VGCSRVRWRLPVFPGVPVARATLSRRAVETGLGSRQERVGGTEPPWLLMEDTALADALDVPILDLHPGGTVKVNPLADPNGRLEIAGFRPQGARSVPVAFGHLLFVEPHSRYAGG
jgi:hypothetical protein